MNIQKLVDKIATLKEIGPDERGDLIIEISDMRNALDELESRLHAIPDLEPEEGQPNPRDEFVDKLRAKAGNSGKAGERAVNVR